MESHTGANVKRLFKLDAYLAILLENALKCAAILQKHTLKLMTLGKIIEKFEEWFFKI